MFSDSRRQSTSSVSTDLVDEEGFERVLSPAERRLLRKNASAAAAARDGNAGVMNFGSLLNKFQSRMKKHGIDFSSLPLTPDSAAKCESKEEELRDFIRELDNAFKSAPLGVAKPIQFKTLEEIDKRIRDVTEQFRRLKTTRGKPSGISAEELDTATQENEVYMAHLREQRTIMEGFQNMKAFQATLSQYKKALLDVLSFRAEAERRAASNALNGPNSAATRAARQQEYICGILRSMKEEKGATLDVSAITKSEVMIMATANRFQPPHNYLRRIKEKFCVHIDPIDSSSSELSALHLTVHGEESDVENCAKFLKSLEFHSSKRVVVESDRLKKAFGGISGLSQLEESFGVLVFYYQGILDMIGSKDGLNLASNYVEEKIANIDNKENSSKSAAKVVSSVPTTLAEHNARKVEMQYDFLICKALSTRFRPTVRTVEADLGVTVSFDVSPKEAKGTIYVNADSAYRLTAVAPEERIKQATAKLRDFIATLGSREVPNSSDEDIISFLFSEETLRSRFVSQDFCLLRYNGVVYVVGVKDALKDAVVRVSTVVRYREHKPKELFVPMEKSLLLSSSTLSAVEDWTSVTIMMRDSINGFVLKIFGSLDQQEECVKQVNEILSTHTEYAFDLFPAHMAVLSDNKYRMVRDLEQQSQVRIILNKENNQLVFHGQKERVDEAVNIMKAFTGNFVCVDQTKVSDITLTGDFYAWLRVPRRHVGAIIGKGGSTLRDIIDSSGLRNMFVNRSDSSDEIVCLEGNKESVQRALEVLGNILEFDGVNQKDQPITDSFVGKYSSANSVLRNNTTVLDRRSSSVRSAGGKPIVFDCRDFPVLGSKS
ncbi:QF122 antigen [Babesia ovata]|uniref:QF122 antigen n=1 Tax=Babesia ovata TaxID=189622 RepID=A0A2H6KBX7_9APIC|nr:QF122 antigen [Babesia ovata]GBE60498.1 QF122 antigen [Babesia ovata]